MAKEYTKKCEVCHKTFIAQRSTAKYCPDCRIIGRNMQQKSRRNAKKIESYEKVHRKANTEKGLNKTLADLRNYNEKYGTNLSYGQFVAMNKKEPQA